MAEETFDPATQELLEQLREAREALKDHPFEQMVVRHMEVIYAQQERFWIQQEQITKALAVLTETVTETVGYLRAKAEEELREPR